jgi:hypothetical protein
VEQAFFDGHINPHDVLPHHPTSTNVQMPLSVSSQHQDKRRNGSTRNVPDLRVAHQTLTEANRGTTSQECGGSMFVGDFVHVGGVSCLDSVAFGALLRRDTPAIVDAVDKTMVSKPAENRQYGDEHEADFVLDTGRHGDGTEERRSADYFQSDHHLSPLDISGHDIINAAIGGFGIFCFFTFLVTIS